MQGVEEAIRVLARHAAAPPPALPYRPLGGGSPGDSAATLDPAPTIAVDGSHAVLVDNGHAWVVAHRAAAIAWPDPPPVEPQPIVTAVAATEAQDRLDDLHSAAGFEAPRANSADALASALCGLAEHRAAVDAVRRAQPGALILIDGALRGLPRLPQAMADRLLEEARARRVRLLGVAKSSRLDHDGHPLVPLLQRHGPAGAWSVAVGGSGTFVARLHPRSPHAFRIDADAEADVEALLPLARDAVYTGYPYPLAVAHNTVALTQAHVNALQGALEDAAHQAGAGAIAALADFHAILDRNVPG